MDYNYESKKTVELDCKTERAICEIKEILMQVVNELETLNSKVDNVVTKEPVES